MSNLRIAVRLRSLCGPSLGSVATVGVGLALYQLTSLELGPSARDIAVNLDLSAPPMADLTQPLEVADVVVGEVSVVIRSQPFVTHIQPRARTSAVQTTTTAPAPASLHLVSTTVTSTTSTAGTATTSPSTTPTAGAGTTPPPATSPGGTSTPSSGTSATGPIIGPCQDRSTGSSSGTQPSNGWGAGPGVNHCSEEGGRD